MTLCHEALLIKKGGMMKTVVFYYDFASPTAYLGYFRLREIVSQYDAKIDHRPILLGALHKCSNNTPPGAVPAKGAYLLVDMPRFSKRYGVPLVFNPHFPVNCIKALRGALVMEGHVDEEKYREAVYKAVWQDEQNIADEVIFKQVLKDVGIDAEPILQGITEDSIKQKLKDNTAEAIARGAFGAPTFFVGEEMFFGQDRLDFVEALLADD